MSAVGMQGIAVKSHMEASFAETCIALSVMTSIDQSEARIRTQTGDRYSQASRQASKHTTVIDDSDGVEMEIQTKRQSAGKCLTGTRRGRSGK